MELSATNVAHKSHIKSTTVKVFPEKTFVCRDGGEKSTETR